MEPKVGINIAVPEAPVHVKGEWKFETVEEIDAFIAELKAARDKVFLGIEWVSVSEKTDRKWDAERGAFIF